MAVEMQLDERMNSGNGLLRLPMAVGRPDDGEESPSSTITTPASTTRAPVGPVCGIGPVGGNLAEEMSSAKGIQPSGAPRSRHASTKDTLGLAVVVENQSSLMDVDSPVSAIAGSPTDSTGMSKSSTALDTVDPLPVATPVFAE